MFKQQRVSTLHAAHQHLENAFGETSRRTEALLGSLTERVAQVEDRGMRGEAASSNTAAFSRNPLVDPKHMLPEAFSGAKGTSWRDWSYKLKAFVGACAPDLKKALEGAERLETPITDDDLQTYGVSVDLDVQLKTLITMKTVDFAQTIVRQHERDPGLEQHRAFAAYV